MATMFARHRVTDYQKWRKDFDTERMGMGVTGHGVYRLDDDPNDVTIYHEFDCADAAKAFINSSRLREVMEAAGVQGVPDIWFTNKD